MTKTEGRLEIAWIWVACFLIALVFIAYGWGVLVTWQVAHVVDHEPDCDYETELWDGDQCLDRTDHESHMGH